MKKGNFLFFDSLASCSRPQPLQKNFSFLTGLSISGMPQPVISGYCGFYYGKENIAGIFPIQNFN
jgi:hypothetical protein